MSNSNIVVSTVKKVNILDKIIQNVVIMVNMSKMNRAIDEHLEVINETSRDDQRVYQENILREIVYVKYQYDIMQRNMYELRLSYNDNILENINSIDKIERLKLQKEFLEMEYDRVSRLKFKAKDSIKYMLLVISSVISSVKQDIKDEGKNQKYNAIIKCAEEIETKVTDGTYTDTCYNQMFEYIEEYVSYINNNYDIAKLPDDEKDIIELVIESTIKGLDSDIDKLNYQYELMINIAKNAYKYFKIIDKIFEKIQAVYDESLERGSININDYIKFYAEIYDKKIKTMVNNVHRTIQIEDEYLEYSKMVNEQDKLNEFILRKAHDTTNSEQVKGLIEQELTSFVAIDPVEGQIDINEAQVIEDKPELIGAQPEQKNEKEEDQEKHQIDVLQVHEETSETEDAETETAVV